MLRRSFLQGLGALFVAPAIVRAENLMPIREMMPAVPSWCPDGWLPLDGRVIKKKFYPDLFAAYEKLRFPMELANEQQEYSTYSVYQQGAATLEFVERRIISYKERRIISYKDLKRPNGRFMRAGAGLIVQVPEGVV